MKKPKVYAFIFARGGSKGLPGKNIKLLKGKPLIAHAIEAAKKSNYIQRVIVSTDDKKIAAAAKKYGAEVPFMRPATLASDKSNERMAWRHAIEQVGPFDIFVSIPATCPLRSVKDIDACIEKLLKEPKTDMVITVTPSASKPHTMYTVKNGVPCRIASGAVVTNRQQALPAYDHVGVAYATRPKAVMTQDTIWDGVVKAVVVPRERALDIDDAYDFRLAELLLK